MVALISKSVEHKAEQAWSYLNYALDNMYIDMDEISAFALVKSQSAPVSYKVRFAEPANELPQATDCGCYDHRTNHNVCKHMHIVNTYYQMIYGVHRAPAIVVSPEEEVVMPEESASEHIVNEQVAAYEIKVAGWDRDELRTALRKAGLVAAKGRVGGVKLNASKEVMREALVARFRMSVEMQAEAVALEALPELPTSSPQVAPLPLDEVDLLLDSGERAAVYLAEMTVSAPVISASFELPKGKKFDGTQGRLNGSRAFSILR
jgi:hypothetical protein